MKKIFTINYSLFINKSRFGAFVKKEFLHIFRDKRTLIILFGIPLVQLLLFGYALRNEVKNVSVAVADYAQDEVSRQLTQQIIASPYFTLTHIVHSSAEYEDLLRSGKAKEIIVFEPGFGQKFLHDGKANIQLIADASEPNTAQLVVSYTNAIINNYVQSKSINKENPALINIKTRMLYNENMRDAYNFIPGLFAMILMLISAMMTAITITREKETGTMEILLASPLKPIQIILGKVTPYFLLSILTAIMILVIGTQLFGVPIKGSLVLLMVEILLFIFLALSLGIMISSVVDTQIVAMIISGFALMMPTILLSGFIFPIKNMPEILQLFSYIMPPRWFIEINRGIMLKGAGLEILWMHTVIMIAFSVFFMVVSLKKFKIRLE
ncbi:MAG: ABC transporter permease [Paludibacteraceae bacterium]|nr:ABC transporter permease [Paludibacteraceae bacterium]